MRKVILLLLSAWALTGCATGLQYSEVAARAPEVPADKGRVFFYRPAAMVAGALRPAILLNDFAVGNATPRGFLFVDTAPGNYTVKTSVLIEHAKSFALEAEQVKYVRLMSSVGVYAGHIIPQIVDESRAKREMQGLAYTGSESLLLD